MQEIAKAITPQTIIINPAVSIISALPTPAPIAKIINEATEVSVKQIYKIFNVDFMKNSVVHCL